MDVIELHETQWSNIPIKSEFEHLEPNASIPIYSGPLRVSEVKLEGEGTIEFAFLPSPAVRFQINRFVYFVPDNPMLDLPDPSAVLRTNVSVPANPSTPTGPSGNTSGFLNGSSIEHGTEERIGRVEFHMVNFRDYVGRIVIKQYGLGYSCPRVRFQVGRWTVVLDTLPKFNERWKKAQSTHGYVITHVGVLHRTDNKLFSPKDAKAALACLYWFLSFLNGARCSYIFPTGYRHGGPLWREVLALIAAPAQSNEAWFVERQPERCLEAADGFYRIWQNEAGRDWLLHAVSLYLASNRNVSGTDVCLATAQITLELLSWVALVEQNAIVPREGFDDLSAADKIRLLLFWCGMSPAIPDTMQDLKAAFPSRNGVAPDGPLATTEVRNAIIHPAKALRTKLHSLSSLAKYEAWQLNMLYIERAISRLIGYSGPFQNRITRQTEEIPVST